MIKKIKVALIFGGRSGEHEVSIHSAQFISSALNPGKYEVTHIGITKQGKWLTGENVIGKLMVNDIQGLIPAIMLPQPGSNTLFTIEEGMLTRITDLDVIFPALHGTYGEDGTLQGFFEMADIAYVGGGVLGSAVGMDKGLFKYVMQANDIPVLPFDIFNRSEIQEDIFQVVEKAENISDYPLFVKPANLGSSVGISKCHNRQELLEGLKKASLFDRRIVIEKGISAREIEISVLGNDNPIASCAGEVKPKDIFYTYEDKYINNQADLIIPAKLDLNLLKALQSIAIKAYKVVDCSGMARVDFLIDKENDSIYLSEINTIPGFTKISMYPKLWETTGFSSEEIVDRLINFALERKRQRDLTKREYIS